MSYPFPGFFELSEEPTLSTQVPPADGSPTFSSSGVTYSTLLQLCAHVETENRKDNPQATGSPPIKRFCPSAAPHRII